MEYVKWLVRESLSVPKTRTAAPPGESEQAFGPFVAFVSTHDTIVEQKLLA
jgi:hypothetical protein